MNSEALEGLFVQGLQALHSADEQCIASATDVVAGVSDPRLRDAIQTGIRMARRQVGQLDRVFRHAGASPAGTGNGIIEAIETATERARATTAGPVARDVGVIATNRPAFHDYIACYGALRDYAQALGLAEAAAPLQDMLDELEQTDRQFCRISRQIVGSPQTSREVEYALS